MRNSLFPEEDLSTRCAKRSNFSCDEKVADSASTNSFREVEKSARAGPPSTIIGIPLKLILAVWHAAQVRPMYATLVALSTSFTKPIGRLSGFSSDAGP